MGTIFPKGQGDIGISKQYATSALYINKFDALTNGHKDIIEQAVHIFENVYMVMVVPMNKDMIYTWESREACYRKWLNKQEWRDRVNFKIVFAQSYANIYKSLNVDYYIHAFSTVEDFLDEHQKELTNKRLVPDMKTIYLKTDKVEISRNTFKTYKEYKEDLQQFVPYEIKDLEEYNG